MKLCCFILALFSALPAIAASDDARWWPTQVFPAAVVRVSNPGPRDEQMFLTSLAGLAAQAVNESHSRELVWVDDGNPSLKAWYDTIAKHHPALKTLTASNAWEVSDRYARAGIVKGYILYHIENAGFDAPESQLNVSVNVATSLAGILGAALISEELQPAAQAHGLKLLFDARDKSAAWCFQHYRAQFTRRLLCEQDPRRPHARDLAIAQRAFTIFGPDEPLATAMQWLEPLSPILGWNGGDEFANTDLSTRWGDIQTATDWSINLPVLMAGSEAGPPARLPALDPAQIPWKDRRSGIAFVDTDGDNVQWITENFFIHNDDYWSNPHRGQIPFGWSGCFAQMAQLCPAAIAYAAQTRTTNDWFIEWGGGYYYPDRFAMERPNRWPLLAEHARRTWAFMKRTNCRTLGFNFQHCDSPDALHALQTIAAQTDGLLAILMFQYDCYEAGAGKVYWVKDRRGLDVPCITARYSIWEHSNNRPRAGAPAKVARDIQQAPAQPRNDWALAHAWSYFKHATNEAGQDLPQPDAPAHGGERGYTPVLWCAAALPPAIRVIPLEELPWRLRMTHNPAQTTQLAHDFLQSPTK
jgi:hypothetical protein